MLQARALPEALLIVLNERQPGTRRRTFSQPFCEVALHYGKVPLTVHVGHAAPIPGQDVVDQHAIAEDPRNRK